MNRLFTISFALGLFHLSSQAQITITSANGYVPGDYYIVQQCSTTTSMPSAAGSSVNVNYGTLTSGGSPVTQTFVQPLSTPYASDFTNSTAAVQGTSTQGNTGYSYYITSASKLEMAGVATTAYTMKYSNPQLVMNFPTTYNNSYSDNFAATYSVNGFNIRRGGTVQIIADAYGSITTPTGTFPYLRLKTTAQAFDSMYYSGTLTNISISTTVTYNYMNNNIKSPVFSYSEITTGSGTTYSAYYYVSGNAGVEELSFIQNEVLFPNPSQREISVSFDLKTNETLNLKVYDINGKQVVVPATQTLTTGTHTIPFNTENLTSGIYSLILESSNGSHKTFKFIVQ